MTLKDGWYDWCVREPGPPDRVIYPMGNNLSVLIAHSLEGRRGGYSAMFDPARKPTAWHATVAYDGTLYQHYVVIAGLAASGDGNLRGPAFESEGVAGEPLTPRQVDTWLHIIRDTEAFTGRKYRPGVVRAGLTEHNHWAQTACPSGRYQPLYDAIAAGALEENMEIDELRTRIERLELAIFSGGEDIRAGETEDARKRKVQARIMERLDLGMDSAQSVTSTAASAAAAIAAHAEAFAWDGHKRNQA